MSCNAIFIPSYKKSRHTAVNPYYGATDKNLASLGINTKDEFIVTEVMKEGPSVCINCRKEKCNEAKEKLSWL
jgi:hypothetical protein